MAAFENNIYFLKISTTKLNKKKQRYPLTDEHLEIFIKKCTSYVTAAYDKPFADEGCNICHYACGMVSKNSNVFTR
jgi:hypothetical protein